MRSPVRKELRLMIEALGFRLIGFRASGVYRVTGFRVHGFELGL